MIFTTVGFGDVAIVRESEYLIVACLLVFAFGFITYCITIIGSMITLSPNEKRHIDRRLDMLKAVTLNHPEVYDELKDSILKSQPIKEEVIQFFEPGSQEQARVQSM